MRLITPEFAPKHNTMEGRKQEGEKEEATHIGISEHYIPILITG